MSTADPFLPIQTVQGHRCWGVPHVCRMQLESTEPRRHECKQAGRCIFAPKEPANRVLADLAAQGGQGQ